MSAMQPIADKFFPGAPLGLCDFRLVMWKNVIDPTAMNIDLIAQKRGRHGTAFYVPARTPTARWAFPADLAIVLVPRLPKRKIPDVLLVVFVQLDPTGGLQLGQIDVRKSSVAGKTFDPVIN